MQTLTTEDIRGMKALQRQWFRIDSMEGWKWADFKEDVIIDYPYPDKAGFECRAAFGKASPGDMLFICESDERKLVGLGRIDAVSQGCIHVFYNCRLPKPVGIEEIDKAVKEAGSAEKDFFWLTPEQARCAGFAEITPKQADVFLELIEIKTKEFYGE